MRAPQEAAGKIPIAAVSLKSRDHRECSKMMLDSYSVDRHLVGSRLRNYRAKVSNDHH